MIIIIKIAVLSVLFTVFACNETGGDLPPSITPENTWCEDNKAEHENSNLWILLCSEEPRCHEVWGGFLCPSAFRSY